ncbi:hypothetical protein Dimus_023756 [Dionaea muscipula]
MSISSEIVSKDILLKFSNNCLFCKALELLLSAILPSLAITAYWSELVLSLWQKSVHFLQQQQQAPRAAAAGACQLWPKLANLLVGAGAVDGRLTGPVRRPTGNGQAPVTVFFFGDFWCSSTGAGKASVVAVFPLRQFCGVLETYKISLCFVELFECHTSQFVICLLDSIWHHQEQLDHLNKT